MPLINVTTQMPNTHKPLLSILDELNTMEQRRLSPAATYSVNARRRKKEEQDGHRQTFSLDADRILHSRAFSRYIDKTQVFCLVSNDHITHRILHVQLVSRIARTIGRFLYLNEDLIEAISLGHDIGHAPFGHEGEHFLSAICVQHGLPPFQHNIQSIRFLDKLERKGKGWNLSLQTLDGILCHDGEIHSQHLTALPATRFADFEAKLKAKEADPSCNLTPMTLEGCVVRLADTVAYIGRDIEDAIILGLIKRADIPRRCVEILGKTNGSIVYSLVTDLISSSVIPHPGDTATTETPHIGFSDRVSEALFELKQFNYSNIYLNPRTKQYLPLIKNCYESLFESFLVHLQKNNNSFSSRVDLMTDMGETYRQTHPPEAMVRDFIAGMTDDFFLQQAAGIGCEIPQKQ
jgi:dGTPase